MLEHDDGSKKRDKKWHEDYMQNLTDFVIRMADDADSIPEWLQANEEFKPSTLLDLSLQANEEFKPTTILGFSDLPASA